MNAQAIPSKQDPRIGIVLQERYRILRKLGDGGMGAVYEGEHLLIKRRVAIKILHSQFADNPGIVARFRREAEAATSIGHPNIIEVTDMGSFPDGTAYMVLELLEGRDWAKDIAQEGPQPLGKVVHIMSQVCDALAAAHAKGIVHRDLKPENIFLVQRAGDPCFVKVLDFGISKFADNGENRSLTQTGTALGTPYYMAPEQCQGKKDIDTRADIYSLGVILFQALTRQYPFDDESYPMLVLKICTEPPPPLAYYRPDLPPQVVDIVSRMLAKDRNHRFATCDEVKAALEPFRHVNAAPVLAADAPSTASRGPSVLEGAVSPASTPAAYAPSSYAPSAYGQPDLTSASARQNGSGTIWAVVAILFLLVLSGGTVGALAAFGVFTPERPVARQRTPPSAVDPPESDDTPPLEAPRTPPAAQVEAPATAAPTVPATPAAETVRVQVTVEGPPSAQIFIDDAPWGTTPFDAEMRRDPAPTAGEAPRLHTIEVRAEGWETTTARVPFTSAQQRHLVMARARAPRRDRPRDTPPPPTVQTFDPRPVVRPTPSGNGGRDLVGIDSLGAGRPR